MIINSFSFFHFLFYFDLGCGEFHSDARLEQVSVFREKSLCVLGLFHSNVLQIARNYMIISTHQFEWPITNENQRQDNNGCNTLIVWTFIPFCKPTTNENNPLKRNGVHGMKLSYAKRKGNSTFCPSGKEIVLFQVKRKGNSTF